jgi:hypothetical protein
VTFLQRTMLSAQRFLLFPGARHADSLSPQLPILKEKLLVVGVQGLQTLAGGSLHIVAFAPAATTYRTAWIDI